MMFNNQDFFYIIMKILHQINDGTVPVPSLYPNLHLAILCSITCSGVIAIGGTIVAGGKPKAKPPGTI
jgi:hypothetical protein